MPEPGTAVNREVFQNAYAGNAPWDIDRPQGVFLAVADRISGSVLDVGCGTGENALFFAARGCAVTGVDFPGAKAIFAGEEPKTWFMIARRAA